MMHFVLLASFECVWALCAFGTPFLSFTVASVFAIDVALLFLCLCFRTLCSSTHHDGFSSQWLSEVCHLFWPLARLCLHSRPCDQVCYTSNNNLETRPAASALVLQRPTWPNCMIVAHLRGLSAMRITRSLRLIKSMSWTTQPILTG